MSGRSILLDPQLQESNNGAVQTGQQDDPSVIQTHGLRNVTPKRQSGSASVVPNGDILTDYDLAVERAQTWTGVARFGFNAMLASPEYKNKLRLKPDKMERILYFLTNPEAKSREKDLADAQAKHQAQHWMYESSVLYRKESRLQHSRRHVNDAEVFDILTAEHLRSYHQGRDKMLKMLEAKYIGYTKDELMYVLDHCLVCSSKHIRGAAARRRENKHLTDLGETRSDEMTSMIVNASG